MFKQIFLAAIFSAAALSLYGTQGNPAAIKKVPIAHTSPVSGKEMYASYCAACHGVDGKGDGPAASALRRQPVDLTKLAINNKDKFPELEVVNTLAARDVAAHGSEEMPPWGDLFKSMGRGDNEMVQMRIVNLVAYLKSIQQ